MTSKIINMAEINKDAEDRRLEALLRAEPIADEGFSRGIVRRIRRRLWIRRITLPGAAAIGAAIAVKPLAALVTMLFDFARALPVDVVQQTTAWLPPLPMIVLGAMLLVVMLLGLRMIEE